MTSAIATFAIVAIVGLAVGVLSGMLGVGGGSVMVPIFRLAMGMSAIASTATSLFTIIPTSLSGVIAHVRNKTCIPRLGIALGIGGALTSPLGVWLAQIAPPWMVMIAVAIVVGYSSLTMLRRALKAPKAAPDAPSGTAAPTDGPGHAKEQGASDSGEAAVAAEPAGGLSFPNGEDAGAPAQVAQQISEAQTAQVAPEAQVAQRARAAQPAQAARGEARNEAAAKLDFTSTDLAKAAVIGAITGVASGFVGLGGGFLMVPLMLSLLNMPMKLASGTSLVAIMILATPATATQLALGNVDLLAGIAMACGSIPGAAIGGRLTARIPERALRFTFAAFLGLAAILLVVKELTALG